jgi:tetratricopeptide (TPR) repeat protein
MKKSTSYVNGFQWFAVTKLSPKMKSFNGIQFLRTVVIIILLLNFTSVFSACSKNEKAVLEAYELRITGKVDAAKAQLENILKEDSTNAMAHFELARTLNYIDIRGSKEADQHLAKALEYDPDNVTYAYYNAKNCFLKAYIALQTGGEGAKKMVENSCNEFVQVLELKNDYPEALMYLVEFYGDLPEELGGNKTKAEEYTRQLEEMDRFYGAKARLVMMPKGTNMVEYWEKYIHENGEDSKALKELGVASLFNDNVENAKKSFEKAIALDHSQNIRLLDLGRYHMMKAMQNRDAADVELPKSKKYVEQYLESTPEPIPPLKAYALGMMVKINMFSGNQEEGKKIMEEAKAIDPYFSRAFGIPSLALFEPPNIPDRHFQSYFIPY